MQAAGPEATGGSWLQKLNAALLWLLLGASMTPPRSLETLESPSARWPTLGEREAAAAALAEAAPLEPAAIARLGARADDYRALAALCDATRPQLGRAALAALLLDGRLTASRDLRGEGDLLDHLTRLATGPLAAGLDRGQLISQLVQELDNPVKLSQGSKSTCAATACTQIAARRNPAEIARLVAGLAAPGGTAVLANGRRIAREPGWDADTGDGRTLSMRLLQPALMEWGNGFFGYDNASDADTVAGQGIKLSGLGAGATRKVAEALTGDRYKAVTLYRWNRGGALRALEAAVAAGKPVPVAMTWIEGGLHQVVAEAIRGDKVILLNPLGAREQLDLAEFRQGVQRMLLPR